MEYVNPNWTHGNPVYKIKVEWTVSYKLSLHGQWFIWIMATSLFEAASSVPGLVGFHTLYQYMIRRVEYSYDVNGRMSGTIKEKTIFMSKENVKPKTD